MEDPVLPILPRDMRWEEAAVELQHTGLAKIQASAQLWEKSIAGLLGVFGLVAFIKGPGALADVPKAGDVFWAIDPARTVVVLILAAALMAGAAVVLAALAGQGVAKWYTLLDGVTLERATASRAKNAIEQLRWSRVLAVLAALTVLLAVALTWWAALDAPDAATDDAAVLVVSGGSMHCGTLAGRADGVMELRLTADHNAAVELSEVTSVTPIEACPSIPSE